MAYLASGSLVRQLGSLFEGGSVAGLSDRQLLERFTAAARCRAEAAFAALVTRHGPMVLDVCRQLLGDQHHAEDAFQAVFLVLARRARSIRDPDLLGNWLYGVALRTARKARVRLARRRQTRGGRAAGPAAGPVEPTVPPAEQPVHGPRAGRGPARRDRPLADAPSACRSCSATSKGLTARRGGATAPMARPARVRSRLARARDKLRRGLTRRGVVLPAAALAAALAPRSASASISSPLCDITTRAAIELRGRTGRRARRRWPWPRRC